MQKYPSWQGVAKKYFGIQETPASTLPDWTLAQQGLTHEINY